MTVNDINGKALIGATTMVDIVDYADNIPAKVDTGAHGTAIWASDLQMSQDGELSFVLFDPQSPLFTGERIIMRDYEPRMVKSAHGERQVRYRVEIRLRLGGRVIKAKVTLADRSQQAYPVLIGRRTLSGRYIVDVAQDKASESLGGHHDTLAKELQTDPLGFHEKYYTNDPGGEV